MDQLKQIKKDGQPLIRGQNVELLNETCALHEGNRLEYMCIDTVQQEYVFKSIYCVTDEDVKQYSLIPLKQIVNAQDKTVFANFPITDRSLTLKIKQITQNSSKREALKLQIDQYFKDLIATILAKLESVQANMVTKAQSISNLSGEITSMYNAMSEKDNLKQILLDASKPSAADKSADVKALCARVLSKDSQNQQAIKAAIEKVAILERAIDFETPKQIKEVVLRQLEQIDMFLIEDIGNFSEMLKESKQQHIDTNESVKALMNLVKNKFNDATEASCSKFQEQLNHIGFALKSLQVPVTGSRYANLQSLTENQTNQIANLVEQLAKINQKANNQLAELDEVKSDELFELISNQTNFCSNEYLHDLKDIFEMMRGVFGLFHTRKLNARTEEQKSFNRLSQAQLKNMARLAAKVSELTGSYGDQYLLSNQPQQSTQSNSAELIRQIKNWRFKNMSVEEQQNIRRDLDQLLVNYPIFETLPLLQIIQIERALPPMIFTRSVRDSSSQMGITYNGSEVQLTLGAEKNGQCNSQIQDNNRGFSLKITFNRPFGSAQQNYFRIGLILNSKIPSSWVLHNSTEAGFQSSLDSGAKCIKGDKLTSQGLRNVTSQLEFRWCVAKQLFFISDTTYQNINQVDKSHFSPTEQYSFAVFFNYLAESDWKVTISDYKEIDPNEVDKFN